MKKTRIKIKRTLNNFFRQLFFGGGLFVFGYILGIRRNDRQIVDVELKNPTLDVLMNAEQTVQAQNGNLVSAIIIFVIVIGVALSLYGVYLYIEYLKIKEKSRRHQDRLTPIQPKVRERQQPSGDVDLLEIGWV